MKADPLPALERPPSEKPVGWLLLCVWTPQRSLAESISEAYYGVLQDWSGRLPSPLQGDVDASGVFSLRKSYARYYNSRRAGL